MMIDGKEVLKKIYELKQRASIIGHRDVEDVLDELIRFVDFAPTIEERKMGKWILKSNGGGWGPKVFMCSACRDAFYPNADDMKYCPNCGAEMEGAEE